MIRNLTRNLTTKKISAIYDWLQESTGMQARALPIHEALQYFVEVQKFHHYKQEASVQRLLAHAQNTIDKFLVSFYGPP